MLRRLRSVTRLPPMLPCVTRATSSAQSRSFEGDSLLHQIRSTAKAAAKDETPYASHADHTAAMQRMPNATQSAEMDDFPPRPPGAWYGSASAPQAETTPMTSVTKT